MEYIQDYASLEEWYWENYECFIKPFVEQHFNPVSWEYEYGHFENTNYHPGFLFKHMTYTFTIVENDKLSEEQKVDELLDNIYRGKSKIMMVCGSRGSGKSAVALWLAEQAHDKAGHNNVYYVGDPEDPELYPKYFKFVKSIDDLPNNCFAIVDEAAIKYNARNFSSGENKDLTEKMVIARHKKITLCLITQNISIVDVNIDRLCDIIIYKMAPNYGSRKKKGETMSKEQIERNIIIKRMKPRNKTECLIEYLSGNNSLFRTFNNPLPSFWNEEKISKSFRNYKKQSKQSPIIVKTEEYVENLLA